MAWQITSDGYGIGIWWKGQGNVSEETGRVGERTVIYRRHTTTENINIESNLEKRFDLWIDRLTNKL